VVTVIHDSNAKDGTGAIITNYNGQTASMTVDVVNIDSLISSTNRVCDNGPVTFSAGVTPSNVASRLVWNGMGGMNPAQTGNVTFVNSWTNGGDKTVSVDLGCTPLTLPVKVVKVTGVSNEVASITNNLYWAGFPVTFKATTSSGSDFDMVGWAGSNVTVGTSGESLTMNWLEAGGKTVSARSMGVGAEVSGNAEIVKLAAPLSVDRTVVCPHTPAEFTLNTDKPGHGAELNPIVTWSTAGGTTTNINGAKYSIRWNTNGIKTVTASAPQKTAGGSVGTNVEVMSIGTLLAELSPVPIGGTCRIRLDGLSPTNRVLNWVITSNIAADVTASVICTISASATNGIAVLSVAPNSGSGCVEVRVNDAEFPCCGQTNWIKVGCECTTCGSFGSSEIGIGSINAQFSLGNALMGGSAGALWLHANRPSADLATPKGLRMLGMATGVNPYKSLNGISRVETADGYVDIVVNDEFSYYIDFHKQASTVQGTNGMRSLLPGAIPLTRYLIENPARSTNDVNTLSIKCLKNGTINQSVYTWMNANGISQWILTTGNGLKTEWRTESSTETGKIVTMVVQDAAQTVASRVRDIYRDFGNGAVVVERVSAADSQEATTNHIFYYENPGETGRYGQVSKRIDAEGRWTRYDYGADRLISVETSPEGNQPDDTPAEEAHAVYYNYTPVDANDTGAIQIGSPRVTTETRHGIVVARTWFAYYENGAGETVAVTERAASPTATYGAVGNLRTITVSNPYSKGLAGAGKVKSTQSADGQLTTYQYEAGSIQQGTQPWDITFTPADTGDCVRATVTHGTVAAPAGIANRTKREVSLLNATGRTLLREQYVYTGNGNHERIDWTAQTYDDVGHVTATYTSDGLQTEEIWGCCGKDSETDRTGLTTAYVYDDLKRLVLSDRELGSNHVFTSTVLDAMGRYLSQTISAGGLVQVSSNRYDLAGHLVWSVDSQGQVTTYEYNGLINTTIRSGLTNTTVSYLDGSSQFTTENGVIKSWTEQGVNPDGAQWKKSYTGPAGTNSPVWQKTTTDFLGRAIKQEKPGFGGGVLTSTYAYNSMGQLTSTTQQPNNLTTLNEYNELGQQVRSGIDVNTNGVLDLAGPDRISVSDTGYQMDSSGNWWQVRSSIIYAGGESATPTTNSIQKTRLTGCTEILNLTAEMVATDLLGNQTASRTYIDRDNKTVTQVVTSPDSTNAATQTTINGQLTTTLSKIGVRMDYSYDPLGRQVLASTGGARSIATATHYNALGQIDYTMDGASNRTTFVYDDQGRRTQVTDALSNSTYTAYDVDGRVLATWGATYPVAYDYDDYGRMTAMYTYRGTNSLSSYSEIGNLKSQMDQTRWLYDEATGLLTNKLYADGHGPSYTYTPEGKLLTRTWARGIVTTYNYDSLGQLTSVSYSDNTPGTTFSFDRLGRQTTITDGTGVRAFTYNDALQLATETNTQGVLQYAFDSLGRPAGFSSGRANPPGEPSYSVSYNYDQVGRFSDLSNNVGGALSAATYSYVPGSDLILGYATDSGFAAARSYEPSRNLIASITNSFGGTQLRRFDYTNDEVGRRTQRTDYDLSVVISNLFAYNMRSELEDAAMGTNQYNYAYDPIGNRRTSTNNAEALAYSANSLNQYTNIVDPSATSNPSYDLDGNMTAYKGWTFVWDAENRLVFASNATTVVSNSYDYMSRRVAKVVNGQAIAFAYQGWAMFEETTSSSTNSYVYGLDLSGTSQGAGTIGGILAANFNGVSAFYAYDANGNVTDLVGTNGEFLAQYQFDPYGNTIAKTGALADVNPFRFSTKYLDAETGLYYYGYRFCQPESGRWASRDPIGERGGVNLYSTFHNMPTCVIDINGLVTSPLTVTEDVIPLTAGEMNDAVMQWYLYGAEGYVFIYDLVSIKINVGLDASFTKKMSPTQTWELPPFASNPANVDFMGAWMKIDVKIEDPKTLKCYCGVKNTETAIVRWKQRKKAPTGSWASDDPAGDEWYGNESGLSDTPGVEGQTPKDLDFEDTLYCGNGNKRAIGTFSWNVRWKLQNAKHTGTMEWDTSVGSSSYVAQ